MRSPIGTAAQPEDDHTLGGSLCFVTGQGSPGGSLGENDVDGGSPINGRRLTNLGTFRAYVEAYLHGLEPIREDMTFLVRQLAPASEGVPIEIYVFSGEQRWVQYEAIMGDIFDHLLAVLDQFDLRVFQQPGGADVSRLAPLVSAQSDSNLR